MRTAAATTADDRSQRRARLRQIHLDCGVDPRFLSKPVGQELWFVSVTLDIEVHAGCLGFTRSLFEFALGATEAEAIDSVAAYFKASLPEANLVNAVAKRSQTLHPEELTFPEQVRRRDIPPTSRLKK